MLWLQHRPAPLAIAVQVTRAASTLMLMCSIKQCYIDTTFMCSIKQSCIDTTFMCSIKQSCIDTNVYVIDQAVCFASVLIAAWSTHACTEMTSQAAQLGWTVMRAAFDPSLRLGM